jgi:hypothetical protein
MHRLSRLGLCALVPFLSAPLLAQSGTTKAANSSARSVSRVLPGTRESAFTIVQGNALNSSNGPLPDSLVRLRDARYGRIVTEQLTDKAGVFQFRQVDPGAYVVELIDDHRTVLAASELVIVNAGETGSAVVKLPFRVAPLGGLLGHTMQQALAVMSAAAASGVLVTNVTGVDASAR